MMNDTLARAVAGDSDAIGALYEQYNPILRRYLVSYTRQIDVDDMLSEIWVRVLRRLPSYQDRGHAFTAWLFSVTRSVVLDTWRYENRRPTVPIEPGHWMHDGPECLIDGWDAQARVGQLIAQLTPNQRRVIALRYLADCSIEQTMRVTGLSKEGVKARAQRGLARMTRLVR